MRVANLRGRAVLVADGVAVDIADVSGGAFSSDPQQLLCAWDSFLEWARGVDFSRVAGTPFALDELGPPVPRPPQVFAIGINYAEHASESGYPEDSLPVTFTKFRSAITGPVAEVTLPTETVDWEVEAVAVIGRRARGVSREHAWDHVAGLTVGQDLSERTGQLDGVRPQFSLAKSHEGFAPIGPWVVTPDEFEDRDDLAIACEISGRVVQSARTSSLIFDIPELIVRLSSICTLEPGDLVFTGTPSGVGNARNPKQFLRPGDRMTSRIEGIGEITQTFVSKVPA